MKRQTVLYVYSGKVRAGAGGLDLVVRQQLQALVESGYRVVFVSRGRYEHPAVRNICMPLTPAHLLSSLPSRYYYNAQNRFFAWLGSWLLRTNHVDLVVGWLQQSRLLFRAANEHGIPCFLNCTVSYYRSRKNPVLPHHPWPYTNMEYFEEEYRRATLLLAPSEFTRDSFVNCGFSAERVVSIGRGADVSRFIPSERPAKPFRLVFFGLVCDRKGILQALNAWRHARILGGEFWIVGHVAKELKEQLKGDLPDGVIFKGFSREPEQLLKQCHVQILPTLFEGMAKSLVEGAACGLVSITTRESGFPVVDGETGYYCMRDDEKGMAERIRFLAHDHEAWRRMSENATNYVRANLTWAMFRNRFTAALSRGAEMR